MGAPSSPGRVLHIGEVARQTRLPTDTIRFYERLGIVRKPPRSNGGFRLYTEGNVRELRFVRRLQTLGLSLAEIGELTAARAGRQAVCSQARDLFARKLDQVRDQIRLLRILERELESDLRTCADRLSKEDPQIDHECPVLTALDAEVVAPSPSEGR